MSRDSVRGHLTRSVTASSAATYRNPLAAKHRSAVHAIPLSSPSGLTDGKDFYLLGTNRDEDKTVTFYWPVAFWLLMMKCRQRSHKPVRKPWLVKPHGLSQWGIFIITLRWLALRWKFERLVTPLKEVSEIWPACKVASITSVSLFCCCSWTKATYCLFFQLSHVSSAPPAGQLRSCELMLFP